MAGNTTSLGFTIFARENASKAFKAVAKSVDDTERRLSKIGKVAQTGIGLSALAGSATALTAAVAPATAAVVALPAAMAATKVASTTLKVAVAGVGDAMSAVAEGDAAALDEALRKLSPNAREFVTEMAGLKRSFDPVQRAVQDRLFQGLGREMTPVARDLLPLVEEGMLGIAAGANSAAKEAVAFGRTDMAKGALNKVFASTGSIMGKLAGATQPALKVVTALAVAGLPLAERMTDWATGGVKAAAGFLSTERGAAALQRTVTKAGDVLAQMGRIGKNATVALIGNLSQASSTGDGLLDTIERLTAEWAAWAKSAEGQQQAAATFQLLHDAASAVMDVLPLVLGPLGAIMQLINGLPEPVRESVIQLLAFAVVVGTVTSRLRPMFSAVGSAREAFTAADGPVQKFRDRISGLEGPAGRARGALGGITGLLGGPWGIALTAGVGALALFATSNSEAQGRVEDLTNALMRNKGVLDENSAASIRSRLETEGVLGAAQKLGLNLRDVADAALGVPGALERVNAGMVAARDRARDLDAQYDSGQAAANEYAISANTVRGALDGTNSELAQAREAYQRLTAASPPAAAAGADVAGSMAGVGSSASTAAAKVQALNNQITIFRARNGEADLAAIAFKDSLDSLSEAFSKNNVRIDQRTGKIKINTQEGRDANRNLIDSIQLAVEHSNKVYDQTKSVDKANAAFAREVNRIYDVLKASGLSREEIDKLIGRYAKMPGQINAATGKIKDRKVLIEVRAAGKLVGFRVNVGGSTGTVLNARGGLMPDVLPGYSPGKDNHFFYSPDGRGKIGLSGGEAVMRPEWTKAVGPGYVAAMNAAARHGGVSGVARAMGVSRQWMTGTDRLGGEGANFAGGGIIAKGSVTGLSSVQSMATKANALYGSWASQMGKAVAKEYNKYWLGGPGVQGALQWAKAQAGKPYIWGGVGPTGYDCSGLWSALVRRIKGLRPLHARMFTTHSFGGLSGPGGFERGRSSPVRVGVTDAGVGHMAGTLAGVNVESRGSRGVVVGPAARGASDGLFSRQYGMRLAGGGIVPWSFDNGGYLPEGLSMVNNGTGAPEPLGNLDKMAPAEVRLTVDSAGSRLDDLLVEVLRRAIRDRGGNVQTVLGRG